MILLTFAHRLEAKAFLSYFKDLKAHPVYKNLYISEKDQLALLLSGEGILSSATSLSSACTLLPNLKKVINLGVAGALNPSFKVGDILIGKIAYASKSSESKNMQFKSFPLEELLNEFSSYDIVSAEERVLNTSEKKYLSHFGDLVDREIWGLAYSANQFNIPISSIKIISDSKDDEEFCQTVKDSALKFSNDLLSFFLEYISVKEINVKKSEITDFEKYFSSHPNIFLTTAQKNLLRKFSKKIKLTDQLISETEEIINRHIEKRPKDISKHVFDFFEKLYSPTIYHLNQVARESIFSLNSPQIKFSPDPIFESPEISFSGKLKNEKHKDEIISKIKCIKIDEWSETINGDHLV